MLVELLIFVVFSHGQQFYLFVLHSLTGMTPKTSRILEKLNVIWKCTVELSNFNVTDSFAVSSENIY
jgi:hypothetical protein